VCAPTVTGDAVHDDVPVDGSSLDGDERLLVVPGVEAPDDGSTAAGKDHALLGRVAGDCVAEVPGKGKEVVAAALLGESAGERWRCLSGLVRGPELGEDAPDDPGCGKEMGPVDPAGEAA